MKRKAILLVDVVFKERGGESNSLSRKVDRVIYVGLTNTHTHTHTHIDHAETRHAKTRAAMLLHEY